MTEQPVAFLDSGIGGLPYLSWVSDRSDAGPLIYIADTENFPYGELPEKDVTRVVVRTAGRVFRNLNPALLVLACNTASVAALDQVRAIASCPVVGTVPAVKPAAEEEGGTIGVLATERTVSSPYLDNLVEAFAAHRIVHRQAAGDIVRYVEERWLDEGEDGAIPVMRPALEKLRESDISSLVIGCTHFLHVLPAISRTMGSGVTMVDSRDGVGRRILDLLDVPLDRKAGRRTDGRFYVTGSGETDSRYRRFAEQYGLAWAGELP